MHCSILRPCPQRGDRNFLVSAVMPHLLRFLTDLNCIHTCNDNVLNYLTITLQIADITNFCLFLFELTTNVTFSLTYNHSPHQ